MAANWTDGRSGPVGQTIGQIALEDLQSRTGDLSNWKGVVFVNEGNVVIGRSAQEAYTRTGTGRCAMWANVSERQVEDLLRDFGDADLQFLLVSLRIDGTALRVWLLPYRVVQKLLFRTTTKGNSDQYVLKIDEVDDKWMLGDGDVSKYYYEIQLGSKQRAKCEAALAEEKKRRPTSHNRQTVDISDSSQESISHNGWPIKFDFEGFGFRIRLGGNVQRT